jgi:4a-hydroxytetrahydrobiopterin dehydratase
MSEMLSETQVKQALLDLPNWHLERGELVHVAAFEDFKAAMEFVNRVAALAEDANHHPDIDIRYNRVRLALTTHDAGGITRKDFELAAAIDGIERRRGGTL